MSKPKVKQEILVWLTSLPTDKKMREDSIALSFIVGKTNHFGEKSYPLFVKAYVRGKFAVHRSITDSRCWRISHIPTGLRITNRIISSRKECYSLIDKILELSKEGDISWDFVTYESFRKVKEDCAVAVTTAIDWINREQERRNANFPRI